MTTMNTSQLADHYGKHRQTITAWVRQGMPYTKKGGQGKEWEFDSVEVAEWREQQAVDNATGSIDQADEYELKRRKLLAETESAELDLQEKKKLLVPLEELENGLAKSFSEVRAQMRNIPARLVSVLIGETDEARFKQVLAEEIDQSLNALADSQLLTEADFD